MPLELRHLRSFVAVAERGSLTRAAEDLHVTQQSLSQQMRTLEARLGVQLLIRSPKGVVLTDAGSVLAREARTVLAQADRAVETVRRAADNARSVLRVGFLSSVANALIPPVVRVFGERHPGHVLETEDVAVASLVAGVREHRLDAGLSRPPLVEDLATEIVFSEPVAAALPEGHALAARDALTLSDLAAESWVLTPRRPGHPGIASTTRTSLRPASRLGWCSAPPAPSTSSRSWLPALASPACRCPRAPCATAA